MKLYEFQGKRIFQEYGIPVPRSSLITRAGEASEVRPPAVVKAQILIGGRGKAGGIKMWNHESELVSLCRGLFSLNIRGEAVRALLVEERAEIVQELYMSWTFKGSTATPILMVSASGGMDIEKVAHETPEKIVTTVLNPLVGPSDYQVRYIAKRIGYGNPRELGKFVNALWAAFKGTDATLVEINPLAVTKNGLLALDSKVVLDNKAAFRHKELFARLDEEQKALAGEAAEGYAEHTITYVPLDGTVGLVSDGAGTGMLTLDLIKDAGGSAANFCEMGGFTSPQVIHDALTQVLKHPSVKSLLVVLIGGFNRMDEMAEGILKYREDHGLPVPAVIRMCGTLEDVGKDMMKKGGIPTHDGLLEAVKMAVSLAEGR
ncbi:MAG: succinate--CoA ligase subunit beta [Bacillota bacterium]|nr:succinate--CoA ligase subunit beta [Bacillota bacterium]